MIERERTISQSKAKGDTYVKTILYEDLYKCLDKYEADDLLDESYAEDTMLKHVSDRYGEIEKFFFINYNKL